MKSALVILLLAFVVALAAAGPLPFPTRVGPAGPVTQAPTPKESMSTAESVYPLYPVYYYYAYPTLYYYDIQNPQKKILEELNLRKQLLKSGTAQTLNPSALNSPIGMSINSNSGSENQSNFARAAHANNILQHANSTSFGYFIPQESSFGNNILAVFPRFNETK